MHTLRRLLYGLGLVAITCSSAELAARIEDRIRDGIPLASSPSWERDLKISDELGARGRPFGHYKKWRLNEWGFRGPSIQQAHRHGVFRVLILGASESFGLYESPGLEFPAQLASRLRAHGDYEVVNTAVVGMTLATMTPYWENWASRFQPSLVVVYASPLFYLSDRRPEVRRGPFPVQPDRRAPPASRYLDRLKDLVTVPTMLQDWRVRRATASLIDSRPDDWEFTDPPPDRLDAYIAHLRQLGDAIVETGSLVAISTHATLTGHVVSQAALAEWDRGRVHIPRAPSEVAARFHRLANDRIRQLSAETGWALIDADAGLSGRPELFGDLVHFTDEGAEEMARLIASTILTKYSPRSHPYAGSNPSTRPASELLSAHAVQ